jgi:dihydroxyacetone kinase-like protein
MLDTAQLAKAVSRMNERIEAIREALNAADRALGDGDTGMTVASVVSAWRPVMDAASEDLGATLSSLGRETRRATGSSLGSVLGIGLAAAGRSVAGRTSLDRAALATMLAAATTAIAERSGASAGDKTVLDSLLRIRDEVAAAGDASLLAVACDAAQAALDEFREREARIGRARMYGARSAGHDDPGMLAAVLLLRAARDDG